MFDTQPEKTAAVSRRVESPRRAGGCPERREEAHRWLMDRRQGREALPPRRLPASVAA
ncbi:MAG: hypothetical protein AAFR52_13750 [Pseudomonadota bacterium]